MNRGYLSEYFEGVGVKTLSDVDSNPKSSNQHEIGTTPPMRNFLGIEKTKFDVTYLWLNDEQETITDQGWATHYNTREGKPRPPEYRFYYPSNSVTEIMSAGDTLFLAIRPNKTILFIVVPAGSTIQDDLFWLFCLEQHQPEPTFITQEFTGKDDKRLDFVLRSILDEIGVEFEDPNANSLDTIIERFNMRFPTTADFSDLARLTLPKTDAYSDPDGALLAWLDHEEAMFRRLERKIVADRLSRGFDNGNEVDVDEFIKYSSSVHNRRKSRMGHSLQNHLKAVFNTHNLKYSAQVITEKGKKPDFIFPSKQEYNDQTFSVNLLTMLAAKSTCKDRWSQILPEAERIPEKHLVTLEKSISVPQTTMMKEYGVQLIVPGNIRTNYTREQQEWIWSLGDFIELVKERESGE